MEEDLCVIFGHKETEDKAVLYSVLLIRKLITSLWEDGVEGHKQVMSASIFSNARHPTKFYNLSN